MAKAAKLSIWDGMPASGKTTFIEDFLAPALRSLGLRVAIINGDHTLQKIDPREYFNIFREMPRQYLDKQKNPDFQAFLKNTLYKTQDANKRLAVMAEARKILDQEIGANKFIAEHGISSSIIRFMMEQGMNSECCIELLTSTDFDPDIILVEMLTALACKSAKHKDIIGNGFVHIDETTCTERSIARNGLGDGKAQTQTRFRTYGTLLGELSKKATFTFDNVPHDPDGTIRRQFSAEYAMKMANSI